MSAHEVKNSALWVDRFTTVEEVGWRIPMFGLPIYDNIAGPADPPEGWKPTVATCLVCHCVIAYVPERCDSDGFCYCLECWGMR